MAGNGWTRSCGLALPLGVKGHLAADAAQHLAGLSQEGVPLAVLRRPDGGPRGLTAGPAAGGGGSDPADRAASSTNEMSSAPSDHSGHHHTP